MQAPPLILHSGAKTKDRAAILGFKYRRMKGEATKTAAEEKTHIKVGGLHKAANCLPIPTKKTDVSH